MNMKAEMRMATPTQRLAATPPPSLGKEKARRTPPPDGKEGAASRHTLKGDERAWKKMNTAEVRVCSGTHKGHEPDKHRKPWICRPPISLVHSRIVREEECHNCGTHEAHAGVRESLNRWLRDADCEMAVRNSGNAKEDEPETGRSKRKNEMTETNLIGVKVPYKEERERGADANSRRHESLGGLAELKNRRLKTEKVNKSEKKVKNEINVGGIVCGV